MATDAGLTVEGGPRVSTVSQGPGALFPGLVAEGSGSGNAAEGSLCPGIPPEILVFDGSADCDCMCG